MNPFLQILPFALVLGLYACYVKVSARMLRRSTIRWKHSFMLAAAVGVLVILNRLLSVSLAGTLGGLLSLITGVALQLLFGAWFLSSRVTSAEERPVGWARAGGVVAMAMLLMGATAVLL